MGEKRRTCAEKDPLGPHCRRGEVDERVTAIECVVSEHPTAGLVGLDVDRYVGVLGKEHRVEPPILDFGGKRGEHAGIGSGGDIDTELHAVLPDVPYLSEQYRVSGQRTAASDREDGNRSVVRTCELG